ncbi:primary-amine oxidase [Ktedonosporobacter rubrisoli]|uniref:Amine oxidase n=1 Tax=Ktedonosporobacter rubrisoli TaxID=2509675 RepID=A0A4P6JM38_KTERU|nr:primary-amine oxidase [Ktedonosporobacter rubrisoli]QBD76163.1 primary-amine oxidase [Ktedonosporobacter rubrisoli]
MSTQVKGSPAVITHPLEPLTPEEIRTAVAMVKAERSLSELVRFVSVALYEPSKQEVQAFREGDPVVRRAFMVLLDKSEETSATYEVIVNISEGKIESWKHISGVQPSIMPEEFLACEQAVKEHPDFLAALAKRGITNLDLVYVDPWSAGNYGVAEENSRRILRTTVHTRVNPDDSQENSYAHPVEGLHALFDLTTMQVIRVDDYGVVPVPPEPGNYVNAVQPRETLKPLEIAQPEGPSFRVNGHHVEWDNWTLRLGFAPREGLILYDIGFKENGKVRPILYRAALSEMVVPYGDASPSHSRQNAFDVGEYGVGTLANALKLGCDCLGTIYYFDAHMADADGNVLTLPNAVCMHEEDYGILWKHFNFRTEHTEVRRSRRLVVSFIATVGIYEYGFFWYFYQDGSIQQETKLTGIMNVAAIAPGEEPKYGKLIAPQLYAPHHQHFFCFRLDTNVDGARNTVVEEQTVAVPEGPENPYGNAFYVQATPLRTELEAQRDIDPCRGRTWKIINPDVHNPATGEAVSYQLMAGTNVLPFAHESSSFLQRAGFTKHHVWVTPYDPEERYPAGNYPNQHKGGDGLLAWTKADRSIEHTDLVLWHTVGVHHIARPEDWPVMPVAYAGFMLRPNGFFAQSPALDVAPQAEKEHGSHCCEHE